MNRTKPPRHKPKKVICAFSSRKRTDFFKKLLTIRPNCGMIIKLNCSSGGTGRRTGLKILRPLKPYRFDSGLEHHVGTDFAPFRFFFTEKTVTRAVVPPLSQNRHARLACSLVNALTTAHSRYHLFRDAPAARISQWFGIAKKRQDSFESFRFLLVFSLRFSFLRHPHPCPVKFKYQKGFCILLFSKIYDIIYLHKIMKHDILCILITKGF